MPSRYFYSVLPNLLALLAGALLSFAFAPCNIYILSLFMPAILLALWQDVKLKQTFLRGWLFGLGFFGVGVSWVYISIHVYGNTNIPIAIFFTALFVAFLALYIACQGLLLNWLLPNKNLNRLLIAFPATWILFEWLRSWLFTGFPWALIAYSQVNSPLRGFIPIIGEYGTGFLVIATSALMYVFFNLISQWYRVIPNLLIDKPIGWAKRFLRSQTKYDLMVRLDKKRLVQPMTHQAHNRQFFMYKDLSRGAWLKIVLSTLLILTFWILSVWLNPINWTLAEGKPLQVSLVQGNIPQQLKWAPDYLLTTLKEYIHLTANHWQSKIIVWPEGAIPLPLPQSADYVHLFDQMAKKHQATLLTGIPVQAENQFQYYNAMMALGTGSGMYYKWHLVPFGEYVPFENIIGNVFQILKIPMSNFIPGPSNQKDLKAHDIIIGPFICYEIAYANALRTVLPKAQLLVTMSDDAWFGRSWASAQHLQIGQFRALQSERELLFATNNGITAVVNARGQIEHQLPRDQSGVLTSWVQARIGSTPWVWLGNVPIICTIFFLFIITWLVNRRERYMIKAYQSSLLRRLC